ncbi:MAG: hypothetical protein AMXMBFR81_20980 [Chthonomonas sp.]
MKAAERRLKLAPIALVTVVIFATITVIVVIRSSRQSLEDHANRLSDCVERANAQCACDYLSKAEAQTYQVTTAQCETLVTDYVAPAWRLAHREGERVTSRHPGGVAINHQFRSQHGHLTALSLEVVQSDSGAVADRLIYRLISAAMQMKHSKPATSRAGSFRAAMRTGVEQDGDLLERLGFRGLQLPGSSEILPWSGVAARFEQP